MSERIIELENESLPPFLQKYAPKRHAIVEVEDGSLKEGMEEQNMEGINMESEYDSYDEYDECYTEKIKSSFDCEEDYYISEGVDRGAEIGGMILGVPGAVAGAVIGGAVGLVRSILDDIF